MKTIQLYCYACGQNHEFTQRQFEELVYSMQAELSESLQQDHNGDAKTYYHLFKGRNAESPVFCLEQHHAGEMMDVEVYGEHVRTLVKLRRAQQKTLYCLNCGEDEALCECPESDKDLMEPNP